MSGTYDMKHCMTGHSDFERNTVLNGIVLMFLWSLENEFLKLSFIIRFLKSYWCKPHFLVFTSDRSSLFRVNGHP